MIKKYSLCFLVLFGTLSCSEKTKKNEVKSNTPLIEKKVIVPKEDYLVFENSFLEENIEGAEYSNIIFQEGGALFSKDIDTPTYIKIPFSNLDLGKGFNVSFTFKTFDEKGTEPQTLIAFSDKYSSPSRIPFYIYYPGNKISGVYGKQLLWADKYDAKNGYSRAYYDSFKLNKDKYYFVSVNYTGSSVQIYVNSELYASFDNLNIHDYKFDHLLIGSLLKNGNLQYPFNGLFYGLSIFNKPLKEIEITSLFNSQALLFEY